MQGYTGIGIGKKMVSAHHYSKLTN